MEPLVTVTQSPALVVTFLKNKETPRETNPGSHAASASISHVRQCHSSKDWMQRHFDIILTFNIFLGRIHLKIGPKYL